MHYDLRNERKHDVTASENFSFFRFQCFADANPAPEFEWLQKVYEPGSESPKVYSRSMSRIMDFDNVTYENQGEW